MKKDTKIYDAIIPVCEESKCLFFAFIKICICFMFFYLIIFRIHFLVLSTELKSWKETRKSSKLTAQWGNFYLPTFCWLCLVSLYLSVCAHAIVGRLTVLYSNFYVPSFWWLFVGIPLSVHLSSCYYR